MLNFSSFNAQGSREISCAGRSSENLCSSSGGAQEKRKSVKLRNHQKLMVFGVSPTPLNANAFFCRILCNLTLCMTKLRVLVQQSNSVNVVF